MLDDGGKENRLIMTICAIMQPTYLPWMGYFDLIDQADIFILLDDVQITRRSWQVRNRIVGANGNEVMLSIPIQKSAHRDHHLLSETKVDDSQPWRRKHLGNLEAAYAKAPYGEQAISIWRLLLKSDETNLANLHETAIRAVSAALGLDTQIIKSSQLDTPGSKDQRLCALCQKAGADHYLSALSSSVYIEAETPMGAFANSGVELSYQNYHHPVYRQTCETFIPYMGIIDALANLGAEDTLQTLRQGRQPGFTPKQAREKLHSA